MNSSHQDKHFDAIFTSQRTITTKKIEIFHTASNQHSFETFLQKQNLKILQRKVQLRTQLHRFLRTEDRYSKTKHTIRLAQTLRTCQNYPHLSTTNINDKTEILEARKFSRKTF